MELHMRSHRWEDRAPEWVPAMVAGFLAGALLMVLELLWSTFAGSGDPWQASHQVAALVLGPRAMESSGFVLPIVAVALVNHYVLGIVFALVLTMIMAPLHLDSSVGMAAVAGAVFGVLLYLFNFYAMVYFYPWMASMRGLPTLLAQIAFGVTAAVAYWRLRLPMESMRRRS